MINMTVVNEKRKNAQVNYVCLKIKDNDQSNDFTVESLIKLSRAEHKLFGNINKSSTMSNVFQFRHHVPFCSRSYDCYRKQTIVLYK